MSATTYERAEPGKGGARPKQIATDIGEAILKWMGNLGRNSASAKAAANYRRLSALTDAQLARLDLKRDNLLERCYGWRAYY